MKNIKSILRKKKILFFFLFLLCVFFCFFKIKQYFICFDLDKCPVNDITVPYRQFLDSLDLFVIKGGEGNASDYFLYDGFRIYCVSLNSSMSLKSIDKVWDGEYVGNGLIYLKPYIADDILLFKIRKYFNLFYLIEMNENLTDITFWFFSNHGCKQSFVN